MPHKLQLQSAIKFATKSFDIENNSQSIFEQNIQRGIEAGIISFNEDKSKITYVCSRAYITGFKNPEEKVRASYFCELVLDYSYPKRKIDFEVLVPRRTPEDRADIVIYEDEELKTPYLVVETKKDGITDAEFKQAIEQAFGNANSIRAKLASVVAGTTKTAFDVAGFEPSERAKNVISDIPKKYGKTPKYRFIKGEADKELKTVSRDELIRVLEKAHDTVWQGGRFDPTDAFDEVSKLLFCKLKDEKNTTKGDPYSFQIGTHELPEEVYKRVNGIYQKAKKEDAEVFKDDIKLEPKVVYNVVEHLQTLAINKIDLDTKGVAFEVFMTDFFKGKMGQFFTPRPIIQFCVEMMNPKKGELILDPACGSGGFLLNALDFVREYAGKNYDEQEARDHWHSFAKDNLYGIEINDKIARVCKMNMIIHDDGHTNVISTDALENFEDIEKLHPKFKKDHFDLILTNPPFGAMIKRSEKDYLDKYKLGEDKQNQKTEILFIERCVDFVKSRTGIIAIVLPDSITINSSLQYVRNYIIDKTQILGIVSLPDFTFAHYGATVKSSLLFLRKKDGNEKKENYKVFMASAEKIGYTATGKDEELNDLPIIHEHFSRFSSNENNFKIDRKYKDKIYIVSISELLGRRIDTKGYAPKFKELKATIENSKNKKSLFSDCIKKSLTGEWGLEINTEQTENIDLKDYELCYVLRNTNFDNNFNLNYSDIALRLIEKNKIKELQLKENDILVEKSGGSPIQPVGRVVLIKNLPKDKPVLFSNFLQKIVIDETRANPSYIYTYLQTLYRVGFMEFIQNQTTGIKNLLLDELYNIQIVLPDKEEQEKIADDLLKKIYGAKKQIDDAYIELNESRDKVMDLIFN